MNNNGYSVSEAAELLRIAERTVLDWIHKGKLNAEKDGKSWRVLDDLTNRNDAAKHGSDAAMIEWLKKQKQRMRRSDARLLVQ